jgi:hypothetical protein
MQQLSESSGTGRLIGVYEFVKSNFPSIESEYGLLTQAVLNRLCQIHYLKTSSHNVILDIMNKDVQPEHISKWTALTYHSVLNFHMFRNDTPKVLELYPVMERRLVEYYMPRYTNLKDSLKHTIKDTYNVRLFLFFLFPTKKIGTNLEFIEIS